MLCYLMERERCNNCENDAKFGFENRHQWFFQCNHVTAQRVMRAYHVKIFRMPATLNDHILSDINSSLIQTSCHKAAFSNSVVEIQ